MSGMTVCYRTPVPADSWWGGYLPSATTGCHVCHLVKEEWVDDVTAFSREDYDINDDVAEESLQDLIPELSVDPETYLLSCINATRDYKSYFISTSHRLKTSSGQLLQSWQPSNSSVTSSDTSVCTTLIVTVSPKTSKRK